jgi:hypothetical protein
VESPQRVRERGLGTDSPTPEGECPNKKASYKQKTRGKTPGYFVSPFGDIILETCVFQLKYESPHHMQQLQLPLLPPTWLGAGELL